MSCHLLQQLQMSQEKFWVLFSKKLAGEISREEILELEELISQNPEWQYAVQNIEELWNQNSEQTNSISAEDAYMLHLHRMGDLNVDFEEFSSTPSIKPTTSIKQKWYWAAAAVLLIGFTSWLFLPKVNGKNSKGVIAEKNEVSTKPGSKSTIQLPDGSTVVLNAGSKLTYTKDFGKEIREVTLTGEGYFDVAKDKEHPFIIHTSAIDIKVLGTVFNVKAYPEDKKTETSLIHGSIEVTIRNRPNDKIILSPSEKLVVDNVIVGDDATTKSVQKTSTLNNRTLVAIDKIQYNPVDSTVAEVLWTQNRLVFREEPFSELAVRLERWYNVEIEINNPSIADAKMNGIFENETIIQALTALQETIQFKFEKNNNKILIY